MAALLAALFWLDLQLPLGIAGGVPYVLPVLLSQRLLSARASILTAIISTLLIGAGWHLSAPAADGWMVATNRALAVFAVWVTAWLGGRVRSAEREALKARQETEPLLEQIVARVQEVFYFLEAGTGRVLFASSAYERIWQRKLESLLANPADWIEAIDPDDVERVEHAFARMIEGNPFDEVYRIILPDGGIRWIHDRGNPIMGEDGRVAHMAGIAEDITVRREAEESLRVSEERLKQIVTHVKDVFWLGDVRTRKVLYVSPAFEGIWGVAVADALECFDLWMEKIHEEDRPRVAAAIDAFFQGAPYRETYRVVREDGSIRWITDAGQVINDDEGKPYHLAGVARDITEQWETEQALRESEQRLSQVVNQIGEVFWLTDLKGNILYVSPAYEGVWGRPREGVYKNSAEWLMSVHPDDRGRVAAEYARGLAGEGFATEFRLVQPDGSERWISTRSVPVCDDDGRMVRMAGVAEDITRRKNEELARLKIEEG
ncbi:MAG: PAS domain-containing protein, partial [Chrysiogenetes bacterium]|nr:PAS domain-containing protein [Chrysiogenetes bacterium]